MTKNTVLTRTTMIVALFVSLFVMGSCTKKVTQVVDQGFSAVYTIHPGDWKADTYTGTPALNIYAVALNVPEVDDKIVANGAVIVYPSFDGGATYDALPAEESQVIYNTLHWKSTVYIGMRGKDDVTAPNLSNIGDILAKVVILDATPLD